MGDRVPIDSPSGDNTTVTAASLSQGIAQFIAAGGNLNDIALPQRQNANDSPPATTTLPKPLKDSPPVFGGNPETFFTWLEEFASFAGLHDFASGLKAGTIIPVGEML